MLAFRENYELTASGALAPVLFKGFIMVFVYFIATMVFVRYIPFFRMQLPRIQLFCCLKIRVLNDPPFIANALYINNLPPPICADGRRAIRLLCLKYYVWWHWPIRYVL